MTDLIDEVKSSFTKTKEATADPNKGPVQLVRSSGDLAPGFIGMQGHYRNRLLIITRRGYRQLAGSSLPHEADALLERSSGVMLEPMITVLVEAFTDGVLIGHKELQAVKMFLHFNQVENLFHERVFREASEQMAAGFTGDPEVKEFFTAYTRDGLWAISRMSGFMNRVPDPNRVWDLWLLIGNAVTSAGFLAGQQLGQLWAERDVLSGIEIATEEGIDGPG